MVDASGEAASCVETAGTRISPGGRPRRPVRAWCRPRGPPRRPSALGPCRPAGAALPNLHGRELGPTPVGALPPRPRWKTPARCSVRRDAALAAATLARKVRGSLCKPAWCPRPFPPESGLPPPRGPRLRSRSAAARTLRAASRPRRRLRRTAPELGFNF